VHDEMPWHSSSGPQSAAPVAPPVPLLPPLALPPPTGAPLPEEGSPDGVGSAEPPEAVGPAGAGEDGEGAATGRLSPLVPEPSLPGSVAPEHAARRQAKTTKPARAGSKRAFMDSTSGKGSEANAT